MPGAKLNEIRKIIKDWKRSNKDTKVVIFSQFTDFIRILADMCQEERWGFRCVSTWIKNMEVESLLTRAFLVIW
jgi:ERCC4-related helicase